MATVVSLIGCGGTPPAPQTSFNSKSTLQVVSSVQFGAVPVGGTGSSFVAMTNPVTSAGPITISQINVTGSGFVLGSLPTLPFTIAPGASLTVGVDFAPVSSGAASGKISIVNSAMNSALRVSLSGNGNTGGEALAIAPSVMNFGTVEMGNSSVIRGTLMAGDSAVTVSTVDQLGEGYVLSGITFPITLSAGQSAPFTVIFTPQEAGNSIGSLAFVTNEPTSPSIELTGSGRSPGAHTVELSWNTPSSAVVGYNIYRGLQSGGPYSKLTLSPEPTTTYTDYSVQSGTIYYYVATSVNSSLQESAYSNQTVAAVP